jgi:hypothetical protein
MSENRIVTEAERRFFEPTVNRNADFSWHPMWGASASPWPDENVVEPFWGWPWPVVARKGDVVIRERDTTGYDIDIPRFVVIWEGSGSRTECRTIEEAQATRMWMA